MAAQPGCISLCRAPLALGEPYEQVIAENVLDLQLTYLWTPDARVAPNASLTWTPLIERPTASNRLPAGVRIELILYDAAKENPQTRFVKTVKFDGPVSIVPADMDQSARSV